MRSDFESVEIRYRLGIRDFDMFGSAVGRFPAIAMGGVLIRIRDARNVAA